MSAGTMLLACNFCKAGSGFRFSVLMKSQRVQANEDNRFAFALT
jgi:hypothetical protein